MTPVTIGIEIEIIDELAPVVAPTATDTLYLLHSGVTDPVTLVSAAEARDAFAGEAALIAMTDAYFAEGGAKLVAAPLDEGSGSELAADLEAFPADLGPGQLVVPEVVTGAAMADLADWAYRTNRTYIGDGPDGADDGALTALAATVRASDGARFASVEADTLLVPGLASGTTRRVPASVVKAALIARSDIATLNPNLAAAGVNGQCRYVIGIDDERSETRRNALGEVGVNTFRTIFGQAIRAYGFRTTADLDDLPLWWDLSGSRTVMAVRARAAAVAEDHEFGQIDGGGAFLASYEAALARELKELQGLGALYAESASRPGYSVTAGREVNPPASLAQGIVRARIRLKTSPFAEHVIVSIVRRALTAEV